MRTLIRTLVIASMLTVGAAVQAGAQVKQATAQVKDAWITAKTKVTLMTTRDLSTKALNVDTVRGVVTLHGKVPTKAEKEKADDIAKSVDGVKKVKNLLQVVPEREQAQVNADDSAVKARVERAFKLNPRLAKSGISVASVNKGEVLLTGTTKSMTTHMRAVEVAHDVKGVHHVATEVVVKES